MIHPTAFIHAKALVDAGARIGARTRVWGFSHVLGGARIGADCNICEQLFIENDVIVGDRVTVKCGVQLWDGLRVGDDVHIGPNVTFTNDKYPKSRNSGYTCLPTHIEAGASIGGGAVILPGLTIGAGAMVGAGAVVTRSVPPGVTVVGNIIDDGKDKTRIHLNRSYHGLYICPMIWRELDNFSSGSVCMVLASNRYAEDDYYRDYAEFMRARWGAA